VGAGLLPSGVFPAGRPHVNPDNGPSVNFGVDATFVGTEAVLSVRGDIDNRSSLELGDFLDAAIELGHRFVVLDLEQVDFIDGSGLRTIGRAADQIDLSGGALTIRSTSGVVRRLLDAVGLAKLIPLELPDSNLVQLRSDPSPDLSGESLSTGSNGMTKSLRRVTGIHSDNEVIDGALQLAVTLARAAVGGADGVSVSLRRHGRLSTVAATDQTISVMDANQYATGEGPCIDASEQGHRFHAESLSSETRWPAFTPRAQALGIKAILSSPLLVQDRPVGALNIYSLTPAAFEPKDQELAWAFATETSRILESVGVDVTNDQLSDRFQAALRAREVIAQAQGVLMERQGIGENDAYNVLRRSSLESARPLHDQAEVTVSSTRLPQAERDPETLGRSHD
jgi:anti-anti-sigma factor